MFYLEKNKYIKLNQITENRNLTWIMTELRPRPQLAPTARDSEEKPTHCRPPTRQSMGNYIY